MSVRFKSLSASRKVVLLSCTAALGLVLTATSAQAGFQWIAPVEPAPKAQAAAPAEVPLAPQTTGTPQGLSGLEPVIDWHAKKQTKRDDIMWSETTEPEMPAEPITAVEKHMAGLPVAAPAAKTDQPAQPEDVSEQVMSDEPVVQGFGSDLALVIALQQIVPAGYQFSFAPGVNPGSVVSWQGGKPWPQVLKAALDEHGLGFQVQNNVVVVSHGETTYAPVKKQAAKTSVPAAVPAQRDLPVDMIDTATHRPSLQKTPYEVTEDSAVPAGLPQEPVTIRRQKPSSLLEKQGDAVKKKQATAPEFSEPVIEENNRHVVTATNTTAPQTRVAAPKMPADPVILPTPWKAERGATMRDVLTNWSKKAGVELYWSIDYDFRIQEDVAYNGTFDEAVGRLLDVFADARPQPYGQLHQGADGPRVLVVKSYDVVN